MRRAVRGFVAVSAALLVALAGLSGISPLTPAEPAAATTASDFDPGYIISDEAFYDGSSLSEADVQGFLNWAGPTCQAGYTCLKSYSQTTFTRPADAMCPGTYTGAAAEPAARIIVKVAQACGIGARVILATLQKEQGLVTSSAPSSTRYDKAMGYACPDTAPCDTQYYGFFNQVYKAAWQFKRYGNPPGTSNYFTWYPVGAVTAVRLSPTASCGSVNVNIRNKATAALYYYTPYTPNAAALTNLYGTGDSCSSYGNRNFWRYYSDWFGNPTGAHSPSGWFDSTATVDGGILLKGWALDPDSTDPIQVRVTLDGVWATDMWAPIQRDDVQTAYGKGPYHGFDRVVGASPGTHQVCVTALNVGQGSDISLGCLTGTAGSGTVTPQPNLAPGSPLGWFDAASTAPGGIRVQGWTFDPDTRTANRADVYVDGVYKATLDAKTTNTGVGAMYPGYGSDHGFDAVVPAGPGSHQVCVWGIGIGYGGNTALGCFTATAGSGPPVGWLDTATAVPGGVSLTGWALDPDTAAAVTTRVTVDGAVVGTMTADQTKANLSATYPAWGDQHGFTGTFTTTAGKHTVCVTAVNVGAGADANVGCAVVTVMAGSPMGWFDWSVGGPKSIKVSGWAFDRDTADPIQVKTLVDGVVVDTTTATDVNPGVGALYPAYGSAHGFTRTVTATPGTHSVCITAVNVKAGSDTSLGCISTTVMSGSPMGWFDWAKGGPKSITVSGWAFDRDTVDPIQVKTLVDGVVADTTTATTVNPGVAAMYPGYGGAHGFTRTVTATPGTHSVCITAVNVQGGSDTSLGCITVTVPTGSPFGWFDSASPAVGGVLVKGWAIDRDTADPTTVRFTVDGAAAGSPVTSDGTRDDVAAAYPGYGSAHGFTTTLTAAPGRHTVCAVAVNIGAGADTSLGCIVVTVASGSPFGWLDSVTRTADGLVVKGWATDPDSTSPVVVDVLVGSTRIGGGTASATRTDVAGSYPGYGTTRGYLLTVPSQPAGTQICVVARNTGPGADLYQGCIAAPR